MKSPEHPKLSSSKRIFVVSKSVLPALRKRRGRLTPLRNRRAIHKAIASAEGETWLASDLEAASAILAKVNKANVAKRRLGRLVFLEPPRLEALAPAMDFFISVAWADDRKRWLPMAELLE